MYECEEENADTRVDGYDGEERFHRRTLGMILPNNRNRGRRRSTCREDTENEDHGPTWARGHATGNIESVKKTRMTAKATSNTAMKRIRRIALCRRRYEKWPPAVTAMRLMAKVESGCKRRTTSISLKIVAVINTPAKIFPVIRGTPIRAAVHPPALPATRTTPRINNGSIVSGPNKSQFSSVRTP